MEQGTAARRSVPALKHLAITSMRHESRTEKVSHGEWLLAAVHVALNTFRFQLDSSVVVLNRKLCNTYILVGERRAKCLRHPE